MKGELSRTSGATISAMKETSVASVEGVNRTIYLIIIPGLSRTPFSKKIEKLIKGQFYRSRLELLFPMTYPSLLAGRS